MSLKLAILFSLSLSFLFAQANGKFVTAICQMEDVCGMASCVRGAIFLTQSIHGGPTFLTGSLIDVLPGGPHGWHVHEFGIRDRSPGQGCISTGGHFNPKGVNHGAPDAKERHVGDLGNLLAQGVNGFSTIRQVDNLVSIVGDPRLSVVGRSIVIHAGEDDLGLGVGDALAGSQATGNSGGRIGCCVIKKLF